jgi:serine/threonine protein kinase
MSEKSLPKIEDLPEIPGLTYVRKIGEGHFSQVFLVIFHSNSVALKVIHLGSERKIKKEISLLQHLDHHNIIKLIKVIKNRHYILLFEFIKSIPIANVYEHFNIDQFRKVLYSIIQALEYAHNKGIIHRDVKLSNVAIDKKLNIKLLDWGCGAWICDNLNPKAGSSDCWSPEMLLGYSNYGSSGDMWSVGVLILNVLTNYNIPWRGNSTIQTLRRIGRFFGINRLLEYAEVLKVKVPEEVYHGIDRSQRRKLKDVLIDKFHNKHLLHLMNHLLNLDFRVRLTVSEA